MTGEQHVAEAEQRLRASDYSWQDTSDVITALGALREAVLAQANATLALVAVQEELASSTRGVELAFEETVAGR